MRIGKLAAGALLALACSGCVTNAELRAADEARLEVRQGFFAESLAEVTTQAANEPAPGSRELSETDLAAVRYALDRALQPIGQYEGYTIIEMEAGPYLSAKRCPQPAHPRATQPHSQVGYIASVTMG